MRNHMKTVLKAVSCLCVASILTMGCKKSNDPDPIVDTNPAGNAGNAGDDTHITFTDTRGNKVSIPYGAMSCAMKVISFTPGNPWTSDPLDMDPNEILGAPDRGNLSNGKAITLGAQGEIVVEFGVYITDGDGMDIYVFEVGNDVEPTKVEVSDDLVNWIYVGDADGSISGVDMKGKVPAGGKYRYVRLTDIEGAESPWTGADVDAVAAIHPVKIGSGGIGDVVEYKDSRGNSVKVPGGPLSFATHMVDFTAGNPWTSDPLDMDPEEILGEPDRKNLANGKAITLGADGVIVIGFSVQITDGEGMDIYVFEVGPDVEATKVELSNDLENWTYVGEASGSLSGVDINGKVPVGAKYKYVRLTDLRTAPDGAWPGADIDAVAVLNPALD